MAQTKKERKKKVAEKITVVEHSIDKLVKEKRVSPNMAELLKIARAALDKL